ncbi:MAG: alpha/beta fold hydrolase [Phycisphaerales bacterium]|nr:alpha/beta fold hydrolase [Phycisphaerales bacterium]
MPDCLARGGGLTKVSGAALACVLLLAHCPGAAHADGPPVDRARVERASALFQFFLADRIEDLHGAGSDRLKASLSVDELRQVRTRLIEKYGAASSFGEPEGRRMGEREYFDFDSRFGEASVKLRILLDEAGRLDALQIMDVAVPASRPADADDDAGPVYLKRDSFRTLRVKLRSGEIELPARLTLPRVEGRVPAVVLVHGSGPHDFDETIGPNKPFRDLAFGLSSAGIAALRYEKRTLNHAATIDPLTMTLSHETIDDAVAAVKMLRQREEIDPARVFVMGHSLGGMAAPFIAKAEPELAGIIVMAGNSRPILTLVAEQITHIAGVDGKITDAERSAIGATNKAIAEIRSAAAGAKLPTVLGVAGYYWRMLETYDPVAAAKELKIPILVLQGERDYQVTVDDFEGWKRGLSGRESVEFRLYSDLNHLMMTGEGKSNPAEYQKRGFVSRAVIDDVVAWVRKR